jgi:hypothetical protein
MSFVTMRHLAGGQIPQANGAASAAREQKIRRWMAGRADPATTSRYDRRGKQAQHKAASLLHVPYRQRVLHPEDDA